MNTKRNFGILLAWMATLAVVHAQQYYWSNFAGLPGTSGTADGIAGVAQFSAPYATAIDSGGNVYVADNANNTIRRITLSGSTWTVTTIAGIPGVSGTADGSGSGAQFNTPTGVAVDSAGNLYVADSGNGTVRKLTGSGSNWSSTTLAGSPGQTGFADGAGGAALFGCPTGVAVDGSGNVYVADSGNSVIRKVVSGAVTTIAGMPGQFGYLDGPANNALFNGPTGVAVDANGNLYVADNLNHVIRKINSGGTVTTLAGLPSQPGTWDGSGAGAMFNYPYGVAVDGGGNVYVADSCNHTIRKVTPTGVVVTMAGTVLYATATSGKGIQGSPGFKSATGTSAMFNYPRGIAVDASGNLYIADSSNNAIRKITPTADVSTIAGANNAGSASATGSAATFNFPTGIAVRGGTTLFVADTYNYVIRQMTYSASVSQPWGYVGSQGSGDAVGGSATFRFPYGIAADNNGNVYVADTLNNTIRLLVTGVSTATISGIAGAAGSADGTGTSAQYNSPCGIAVDASGSNLYVADTFNCTIRKLTGSGTIWASTTIAGTPELSGTADGTGGAVRFGYPTGVAVDSASNVYVADAGNFAIRKLTPSGTNWTSTTLAGTPGVSGTSDGTGGGAQFGYPAGIAVDSATNIYVADSGNSTIRKMTRSGSTWTVTTIGGIPGIIGSGNGAGASALFANPYGITVDANGNLFVADSGNNRLVMGSFLGSGSATSILATTAILNGMVNPDAGTTVTAYFRYGTTTAYATGTTTSQSIGSGTSFVALTGSLTGLAVNTTYHYQVVEIINGTYYYGADQTFITYPNAIPSISSTASATGTAGLAFSYQIAASNGPTGWGASPLPPGLTVDPNTGLINGTPTATSTTSVTLSATNTYVSGTSYVVGTGTKALTLFIVPLVVPVISSGTTGSGVVGSAFNYAIVANNNTTSYSASGLPSGLGFNTTSGLISGLPTVSGTYMATIGAINLTGTTTAPLQITILPIYTWSNLAGVPASSGTSDGTVGVGTLFYYPGGLAVDSGSNVFVVDSDNETIRKVTLSGSTWTVTTIAGSPGQSGSLDGVGSAARFNWPSAIAVDANDNLYVADSSNQTIRKITLSGTSWTVTTILGTPGQTGTLDGTGGAAQFYYPQGITVDGGGNLYVADSSNSTIRKATLSGTSWTVKTIAGTPRTTGSADGGGGSALFSYPGGITVDGSGNLYVADTENCTIRKATLSGTTWTVTTILGIAGQSGTANGSGTAALLEYPSNITVDGGGNLYLVDNSSTIRKATVSGTIWTLATYAGSPGQIGSVDGAVSSARFYYPGGVAVDSSSNVYVADTDNDTIRKITPPSALMSGMVSTIAGVAGAYGSQDGVGGTPPQFFEPNSAVVDGNGNLYIADTYNSTIRMLMVSGSVRTIAGVPKTTGSTDGTGSGALFNTPSGIALDSGTNLYIADSGNDTIRKLTLSGGNWTSATLAGSPGVVGTTNGTAAGSLFDNPLGIALDSAGNIYVADSGNNAIRKMVYSAGTWNVSTMAGTIGTTGTGTTNGVGTAAKFNDPAAVAVDASGNVYVVDRNNNAIRLVTSGSVVTTLAGADSYTGTGSLDGLGTSAMFTNPTGIALVSGTNLYVGDSGNEKIRKITATGTSWMVMTIGGNGNVGHVSGQGTNAEFYGPAGMAVDSYGNVYVADTSNSRISIGVSSLAPAITSSLTANGTQGSPFSYTITASSMTDIYSSYGATGLPSGLAVNASTGLISGTPTASGTFTPVISAANLSGSTTAALTLTINSSLAGYQSWRNANFTPSQLANSAISGDTAAPAGDGISNLIKYALNLTPMADGAAGLPVPGKITIGGTNYLTLTYTQVIAATDITYTVEISGDLHTWNSGVGYTSVVSTTPNTGGLTETVVVQDATPIGGATKQFIHLKVTGP